MASESNETQNRKVFDHKSTGLTSNNIISGNQNVKDIRKGRIISYINSKVIQEYQNKASTTSNHSTDDKNKVNNNIQSLDITQADCIYLEDLILGEINSGKSLQSDNQKITTASQLQLKIALFVFLNFNDTEITIPSLRENFFHNWMSSCDLDDLMNCFEFDFDETVSTIIRHLINQKDCQQHAAFHKLVQNLSSKPKSNPLFEKLLRTFENLASFLSEFTIDDVFTVINWCKNVLYHKSYPFNMTALCYQDFVEALFPLFEQVKKLISSKRGVIAQCSFYTLSTILEYVNPLNKPLMRIDLLCESLTEKDENSDSFMVHQLLQRITGKIDKGIHYVVVSKLLKSGKSVRNLLDDDQLLHAHLSDIINNFTPAEKINISRHYYMGIGVQQDDEKAVAWLRQPAEQGDPVAQTNIGIAYTNGSGVVMDKQIALEWFLKAAAQNYSEANIQLGFFYQSKSNHIKAMEFFLKAADQGSARGENNVGYFYENGKGVHIDNMKAIEWYQKAAEHGDVAAQCNLGSYYVSGIVVKVDYIKAMEWFLKAANQGNSRARYAIAELYMKGLGVKADEAKAVKWYSKAARKDYVPAQNSLGELYTHGKGNVKADIQTAKKWFLQAAHQNDSQAQYKIGLLYAKGIGAAVDHEEAVQWYLKAAEQGHADSQFQMGVSFEKGEGVILDIAKAFEWYLKAANQGHVESQLVVGRCFEKGEGVLVDTKKAKEWYVKANHKLQKSRQCISLKKSCCTIF